MSHDPEKERAGRLKQAQVSMRSPGDSKIRGYDWSKHDKKAKRIAVEKKKHA